MPRKTHVTAYLRATKKGRFWYASWYEAGRRIVRATDIERNPNRRTGDGRSQLTRARSCRRSGKAREQGNIIRHLRRALLGPGEASTRSPSVDEGKEIHPGRWCEQQRGWLEKYVIGDPHADPKIEPSSFALKPLRRDHPGPHLVEIFVPGFLGSWATNGTRPTRSWEW